MRIDTGFGDPDQPIDTRTLRIGATGRSVVMQSGEDVPMAVVPASGDAQGYIEQRIAFEADRQGSWSARVLVWAVATIGAICGMALWHMPIEGVLWISGAAIVAHVVLSRARVQGDPPRVAATIPVELADELTERDERRIRRADPAVRDKVVDDLVMRRLYGYSRGDTSTAIPVVR